METTSDLKKIEDTIKFIDEVTSWSRVPAGSVLRVHAYSYANWGIQLTPDNIDSLINESAKAYAVEWQETDASLNKLVAAASELAGLSDVNANLNRQIGKLALSHVHNAIEKQGSFVLLDLGAGLGSTTEAVLDRMIETGIMPKSESQLILVDPSLKRLETAHEMLTKKIDSAGIADLFKIATIAEQDIDFLQLAETSSIDLVVGNAYLHHHAFNTHLQQINQVLKPGAPFIIGDWHNSMWEKPERVFWLLRLLMDPEDKKIRQIVFDVVTGKQENMRGFFVPSELTKFKRHFIGPYSDRLLRAFDGLTMAERQANCGIIEFWAAVAQKCDAAKVHSPIYFLEGHERVSKRVENLTNAGFVFDSESRQRYMELLPKRGELAAVMTVRKKALIK
ncbi:MAG: class I SAM-dependent methyltransferase [Candidatus Micrarchaeota archaeon]